MYIFKDYKYKWWQIGIFKLALLALGVVIGAYWQEFFRNYFLPLLMIAVLASIYVSYISFKQ